MYNYNADRRLPSEIIFLLLFSCFIFPSCNDINEQEKYQSPDWLAGKLYTQVETQEDLGMFAEWLRLTGMDSIINTSGSFTVFAPNDEAMTAFLQENAYTDFASIPAEELKSIVLFHILQNGWNRDQFSNLDRGGWINPEDPDSEPKAYKRQTLLKNPNEKYWIQKRKDEDLIVLDSSQASRYKMVYTRSRKYAPIFFDEFFGIYDLSFEDYSFYFDRDYEPGNIYFANAKVVRDNIFAENGYVYVVDKVVKPMKNAKELLEEEYNGESYKVFLELIYQYPQFSSNLEETYDQAEARAGEYFDTLFNLSFPNMPFSIHEELTGSNINTSNNTYLNHNAVYVPTDGAFQQFLDEVVTAKSGYPHWESVEDIPARVMQIIVQSHFNTEPLYLSDIKQGFQDLNGDIVNIDESSIIRKEFGSNCTFIGLDSPVSPRAFGSITGPVYLRPAYSTFLYAIEYTKVLNALSKAGKEYCFFVIDDGVLQADSSLMMDWIDEELDIFRFRALDRGNDAIISMPPGVLVKRILNQVGKSLPTGSADKEFIETLGGQLIIWDNVNNTVQGSGDNVFGFQGVSAIEIQPTLLEEPTDNGQTYSVEGWFHHSTADMYSSISRYPKFRDLMQKAGLFNIQTFGFPFLTEGESYTIFIPSETALDNYGADTLSIEELEAFLKYHFVRGEKIFTDNKKPWGNYETMREDESSTSFNKYYSTLNLRPGRDVIDILDENGDLYVSIPEQPLLTNRIVSYDTDKSLESTFLLDYIITAVIHEIDTVLVK